MNVEALPYTVLLLLLQAGCGHTLVTVALDWRGNTTRGFIRLGAAIAIVSVAAGLWLAFMLAFDGPIGDYPIRTGLGPAVRGLTVVLMALSLAYTTAAWRGRNRGSLLLGAGAAAAALALLGVLSAVLAPPTWGYPGVLLALLAGSLTLGLVNMAMSLGHWYLVTPRLPERPLVELTVVLMAAIAAQGAIVFVNAVIPAAQVVTSGLSIGENPAFWLRIVVGIVFPSALAYMAWRTARERGMMSATGLLYIAVGAVLAGETLARGLLLTTAVAA